ncbi:hypothetical protein GJAV_G00117010, partial [Gymnothorax javanicus]
ADSSEKLRHYGLSQLHSHPVLLTRTRACPLIAPPKPPPTPRWKLIRPRKERNPTDEPKEMPISKPDQFIEVSSLFLNYNLRAIPTPPDLEEQHQGSHGKRTCSSSLASCTEMEDERGSGGAREVGSADTERSAAAVGPIDTSELSSQAVAEDEANENGTINDQEVSNSPLLTEKDKQVAGPSPPLVKSQEDSVCERPMLRDTWIDLDDLCKCFQTLLIFHKPNTYSHQAQKSQLKICSAAKTSGVFAGTGKQQASSAAPAPGHSQAADETGAHFLLVDSLMETEILMSFSALLHTGEAAEEEKGSSAFRPGSLTAEPYSWRSARCSLPVLCIQTTSTKAAILRLPPGRHVLRCVARAPLGYHLHLCSTTPFVFGDEECVMPQLDKESLRFIDQAADILKALGRAVNAFTDEKQLSAAMVELVSTHCPSFLRASSGVKGHFEVFNEAVFNMMTAALGRTLAVEEAHVLRALVQDPFLGLGRKENRCTDPVTEPPETWRNRDATETENLAANVLQATWKGFYTRHVLKATRKGTQENMKAFETLQTMWAAVESNAEKYAVYLLRYIFSNSKESAEHYPCHGDEWTRVPFSDFSVTFTEQPSNSWFLVFREVFHVPKDMLMVPKVYSPVPGCVLHVIDNDSGEEVPRVFQTVEPRTYKPNKEGYTFVAEAHTRDAPLPGGQWRLRIIGSHDSLPTLSVDSPQSNFSVKEFQDYYIPSDKNIICRFTVKVTKDLVSTIQIQASKPGVYVKLAVLDQESEVASSTGKGSVVIPVFQFLSNKHLDSPPGDSSPANDLQGSSGSAGDSGGTGLTGAPVDGSSGEGDGEQPAETLGKKAIQTYLALREKGHKYIIQAQVLHKSWPLDHSQAAFAEALKDAERSEAKVSMEKLEDVAASMSTETLGSENQKPSTPKPNRKAKEKEREKASAKPQSLDASKPHWVLRMVFDHSDGDAAEIKKDTERLDEIRAIQRGWESAEPGRAVKAMQARLRFINKNLSGGTTEESTDGQEPAVSTGTEEGDETDALPSHPDDPQNLSSPREESQTAVHPLMDFTPFIRKERDEPVLKDELIEEAQRREKAERIQAFRLIHDTILERREEERISRELLKRRHLDLYESLQMALDEERRLILQARDSYWAQLPEPELKGEGTGPEQQAELEKTAAQPQVTSRKQPKSASKKK